MSVAGSDATPLIRCNECDLLQRGPALPEGGTACCPRCGGTLYRTRRDSLNRSLALMLAALPLWLIANVSTFMIFELKGQSQSNQILSGVVQLGAVGYGPLAALILFTSMLAPLLHMLGMVYLMIAIKAGSRAPHLGPLFRVLNRLRPWSMLEVYLLGTMVAVVKLDQMASIEPATALYAFGTLIVVLAAAYDALDPRVVWAALPPPKPEAAGGPSHVLSTASLISCESCSLLCAPPRAAGERPLRCPRCRGALERRKPASLSRTWALALTAAILYVPANAYPVLQMDLLGKPQTDTIYEGVVQLFGAGMWEIGALVFFASIAVPMLKLFGLTFLLLSVHGRWRRRARERTVVFRIVEYVGRWSMIDMFMTSILVALVQLGAVATIVPGVGATCFAAVVVTTMFAARAFDPRLIWDATEVRK